VSEVVAANRWLEEVYDPVIAAVPEDLSGRLPPAEIFHEVLEHRWYMSETAGPRRRHHRRHPGLRRAGAAGRTPTAGKRADRSAGGRRADRALGPLSDLIVSWGHRPVPVHPRPRRRPPGPSPAELPG
jgi:hypothetical protein